jgi:hypothetical protein
MILKHKTLYILFALYEKKAVPKLRNGFFSLKTRFILRGPILDFGVFQILFYTRTWLDMNLEFDFISAFHSFPFCCCIIQNG